MCRRTRAAKCYNLLDNWLAPCIDSLTRRLLPQAPRPPDLSAGRRCASKHCLHLHALGRLAGDGPLLLAGALLRLLAHDTPTPATPQVGVVVEVAADVVHKLGERPLVLQPSRTQVRITFFFPNTSCCSSGRREAALAREPQSTREKPAVRDWSWDTPPCGPR